jgi:beta-glucanase (GH16 family)
MMKISKLFPYNILKIKLLFISLLGLASCQSTSSALKNTQDSSKVISYTFDTTAVFWQDEFDGNGLLDTSKWSYDVGGQGWGNNELQFYTEKKIENARQENGKLIIEARKETVGANNYTSARLVTKNKADFLYGRLEVRAKLPSGRGTWPAIWMLPTTQNYSNAYWPDNGEIDIMEHVGFNPNVVHFSIHCQAFNWPKNTQKTANLTIESAATDFHIYRLDWTPTQIDGYIDGQKYFSFTKNGNWQEWPFDKPFHLLLNVAVGGNWGGQKGVDEHIFPQKFEIDYVRVYKLKTVKSSR